MMKAAPGQSDPPASACWRELILGGQRSGKSRRAELLAQQWLAQGQGVAAGRLASSGEAAWMTPESQPGASRQAAISTATSTATSMPTSPAAQCAPPPAGKPRRAVFIVTAEAGDEEMQARIRRHRADRAKRLPGVATIEEPRALAEAVRDHSAPDCLLVIDCLTLWLANGHGQLDGFCDTAIAQDFLRSIEQCAGPVVMVSNEIGLGVVPLGREVRAYVDALGWLNQQVARRCERVCLMVAGLPLWLKAASSPGPDGSDPCLGRMPPSISDREESPS